jgi:hypothetical protein
MQLKELSKQDIEDLLVGAKIMGTGGGGETEWARPLIQEVYENKKKFRLVDPKEIPGSERVAIVSRIGGGITKEEAKKVENLPKIKEKTDFLAFKLLSKYIGQELYAVLPTELGAGNTLAAMYVAAMLDKPAVDADCTARAKPEVSISTTNVCGVPVTPACLVTLFGDVLYVDKVLNDVRAEQMLRAVAAASGGMSGLCRCPMQASTMRKAVAHNTVSMCIQIGNAIRESTKAAKNPVDATLKVVNGMKFFEGKVSSFERKEYGGFMWGDFNITGTGDYSDHDLKVWYKNEHLISWLDGKPYVSCPDSICVVEARTGMGLSNWGTDFSTGRQVVVFGVKAHPLFRTKKGLEIFTPKYFGYDIEYAPIEQLVT